MNPPFVKYYLRPTAPWGPPKPDRGISMAFYSAHNFGTGEHFGFDVSNRAPKFKKKWHRFGTISRLINSSHIVNIFYCSTFHYQIVRHVLWKFSDSSMHIEEHRCSEKSTAMLPNDLGKSKQKISLHSLQFL